jgi:glycosyltransferase involved in cell wall biosynthesis
MSEAAREHARVVMIGTAIDTQGGVSTVVGVLKGAGLFDRCGLLYIPTHRDGGAGAKLAALASAWLRYMGLLLAGKVALVHAHTASRASFWRKSLFILPAFLARVPVILHLHGAEFQVFYGKECSAWARRFVRWVFQRVSQVVVLSGSWESWVRASFPAAKVRVIANPILVPELATKTERSPRTLLFLGRLGKRKGVYDLLRAVAGLKSAYPDLRVLLGGDGELDAVRAEASALGIGGQVELLGWVKGADKARLLNEASVYVLPSYNEGLPMSVLEAMAHGLPVVSTPVGGIPEAVRDGVEGFLVTPGDVEGLVDRIGRLLADPALRERMGDAARARAEAAFGAPGIVERWVALYGELGMVCQ